MYKHAVTNRRNLAICFFDGYNRRLKINRSIIIIPGGSNHE
jgi:hypothetical protein